MTIPQSSPPAPAPAFDALTTREIDVLIAKLSAGWRVTSAVYPTSLCPLWRDTADLLADLNGAWWAAYARENPERDEPQASP